MEKDNIYSSRCNLRLDTLLVEMYSLLKQGTKQYHGHFLQHHRINVHSLVAGVQVLTHLAYLTAALINSGNRVVVKYALCDLVPFVQFKKREKHPWRSVNFTKVAG